MDINTIFVLIILFISIVIAYIIGNKIGKYKKEKEFEKNIPELNRQAIERSRAILSGQFSEQISPILPDFKYNPSDCRFIGKPIDFIVFNGLSNGDLKDITFLEVKSGNSKLNSNQKELKKAIIEGKVKFEEYRVSKELTDRKD